MKKFYLLILLGILCLIYLCVIKFNNENSASPELHVKIEDIKSSASLEPEKRTAEDYKIFQTFDKQIEYHGIVIDQNNVPIEGVVIKAHSPTYRVIDTPTGPRFLEAIYLEAITDHEGKFSFTKLSGTGFTIDSIKKNGYTLPPLNQYQYQLPVSLDWLTDREDKLLPTREKPIIIVMWKFKNRGPLFECQARSRVIDQIFTIGESSVLVNVFNLTNGYPRVVISNLKNKIRDPDLFDFEGFATFIESTSEYFLEFKYKKGQICPVNTPELFHFVAPDQGYQNLAKFKIIPNRRIHIDIQEFSFYFKSDDAKTLGYCSCKARFKLEKKMVSLFEFELVWNKNGSDNLEYDPGNIISPKSW